MSIINNAHCFGTYSNGYGSASIVTILLVSILIAFFHGDKIAGMI
jgi:hypothetical protein